MAFPHSTERLTPEGNYLPIRRGHFGVFGNAAFFFPRDEPRPRLISLFPLPQPPAGSGCENFYRKGGRFGPHNQHHANHQACLEDRDDIAYLTYFNAGLRVYDIRDARMRERERIHRDTIMQTLARQVGDAAYSGHSLTILLNRLRYWRLKQRDGRAPSDLLGGQDPTNAV